MSTPPEVLFDRYFRGLNSAEDRKLYRGKKDLDSLSDPVLRLWLSKIQGWFNESLNQEQDIPDHVEHPPFHLDYIDDSGVPNAIAFRSDGYSFIGITMTLISTLWEVCIRLSRSDTIVALIGVGQPLEECGPVHVLLSQIQHRFIIAHEYTHHVHGHLSPEGTGSAFFNEIVNGEKGKIEEQTFEYAADAYAVVQVLNNLIDCNWRQQAVMLLNLDTQSTNIQDQALFSCFVVAIGGYLFSRPPDVVDSSNIHKLEHPPQAARMDHIMRQAVKWSKASHPGLTAHITPDRFQSLMNAVGAATSEMNGGKDWSVQTAFLQSDAGCAYLKKLDESVQTFIQSLGSSSDRQQNS
jgi:hypothetical protein